MSKYCQKEYYKKTNFDMKSLIIRKLYINQLRALIKETIKLLMLI